MFHWTFLILALLVIFASCTLSVQDDPSFDRQQEVAPIGGDGTALEATPSSVEMARSDHRRVVLPILNVPLPGTCTFRRITGIPCPGCGLTRSFISLAHGQWKDAWHFNPAGWFYFAIVVFQVPYRTFQIVRIRQGLPPYRFRRLDDWVLWGLALSLLVQWVAGLVIQCVNGSFGT